MEYMIGIDVGTSSVKAARVTRTGSSTAVREVYREGEGQSPGGWWKAVCRAVRTVSEGQEPPSGIGLTTQVGTYLLYEKGREPARVYGWGRADGARQLEKLERLRDRSFYREHISMPLPKLISYPAPRLLWFREELREELDRADRVLAPKDYLYQRMTGQMASDYFTWNGLVDGKRGQVTEEILELVGIPGEKLPTMYPSTQAPGRLTGEAAKEMGLTKGIPVYLGCNDCHASLVGMGVTEIGQQFDLTGTSEHVGMITERQDGDDAFTWSPFFTGTCAFGVTASSGRSLDWGFEQFGAYDSDLLEIYEEVVAGRRKPPLFLPYLCGERSPIWDMSARGAFVGLHGETTKRELLYSVLEGVVYSIYDIWQRLGEVPGEVRLGGGAAHNPLLGQMKADLFASTFSVPQEKQSGALGAALIASVGGGWYPTLTDAAATCVHTAYSLTPQHDAAILRERFTHYQSLYPRLRESFGYFAQ